MNREMNRTPRVVALTGFMGAGKTTVARALARRLSCDLLDLDLAIETETGRTPRSIIDEDGEPRFRELETQTLRDALRRAPHTDAHADTAGLSTSINLIIALGGGTWTLEQNRDILRQHDAFTVWLDAPFDLCWRRILQQAEQQSRPLARDCEQARRLYEQRRPVYSLARLHLPVEEAASPQLLARRIAEALSS
ncbi:MAG TPA: shikimate kinase [Pyrinomonadaceae bacterium]|jgi:shikimate kinase